MGKLATFEILLNNGGDVVRAGDTVSGQVVLELLDDLHGCEVSISLTGMSSVQWAESQKASPLTELNAALVDPIVAEEVYVNQHLTLWPSPSPPAYTEETNTSNTPQTNLGESTTEASSTATNRTLRKGTHMLDFLFHMPDSAPSSFHGLNGFVHYKLKAVVERALQRGAKETKVNARSLIVVSDLDLNDVYEARESVNLSQDQKVSMLFIPSGHCHATMRLSRKGFTHGETIPVEFTIHNDSSHAIHNVFLVFKMVIVYKTGNKKCESSRSLAKRCVGKVPAWKTLEGVDKKLRVPLKCQPSGLPGCSLIDIRYTLELKIKPSVLSFQRLVLQTDVIVGTTPLTLTSFHDNPPDYLSCCPPSYESVMALALPRTQKKSPPSHSALRSPSPNIPTPR